MTTYSVPRFGIWHSSPSSPPSSGGSSPFPRPATRIRPPRSARSPRAASSPLPYTWLPSSQCVICTQHTGLIGISEYYHYLVHLLSVSEGAGQLGGGQRADEIHTALFMFAEERVVGRDLDGEALGVEDKLRDGTAPVLLETDILCQPRYGLLT